MARVCWCMREPPTGAQHAPNLQMGLRRQRGRALLGGGPLGRVQGSGARRPRGLAAGRAHSVRACAFVWPVCVTRGRGLARPVCSVCACVCVCACLCVSPDASASPRRAAPPAPPSSRACARALPQLRQLAGAVCRRQAAAHGARGGGGRARQRTTWCARGWACACARARACAWVCVPV
jgi:hypothetical protein